jgi:hypothetical protein
MMVHGGSSGEGGVTPRAPTSAPWHRGPPRTAAEDGRRGAYKWQGPPFL